MNAILGNSVSKFNFGPKNRRGMTVDSFEIEAFVKCNSRIRKKRLQ
jgi:hypothetical protein